MNSTLIAAHLLEIQAVKLSPNAPFTWASGMKSPIYCDNRKTLSYPHVRNAVKAAFVEKAKDFEGVEVIAGVATAGIPHGALLADALGLPYIYVRNKPKDHGMQNLIEGELKPGQKVLVIEDLISTGGSSLQAVEGVRQAGGEVVGVLAIFTYKFPAAAEAFEKANCRLETLTDYPTLVELAKDKKYISDDEFDMLLSWCKAPQEWKP